jgi:hypothetical protein
MQRKAYCYLVIIGELVLILTLNLACVRNIFMPGCLTGYHYSGKLVKVSLRTGLMQPLLPNRIAANHTLRAPAIDVDTRPRCIM